MAASCNAQSNVQGGGAVDQGDSLNRAAEGAQADSVPDLVRADRPLMPQQPGLAEDHAPQPVSAALPDEATPHAGAGMQPRHSSREQHVPSGMTGDASGVPSGSDAGRGSDVQSAEHEWVMRGPDVHAENMPGGGAQLAGALSSLFSSTAAADVDELLLTLRY